MWAVDFTGKTTRHNELIAEEESGRKMTRVSTSQSDTYDMCILNMIKNNRCSEYFTSDTVTAAENDESFHCAKAYNKISSG